MVTHVVNFHGNISVVIGYTYNFLTVITNSIINNINIGTYPKLGLVIMTYDII